MQYTAIYQAIAHSLAVEPVAGQQGGLMGFSPKSLFASGAQGAWYDPSDYSTMFEDAAGTIPITTPLEKPVGLMLDKSKGLVLGAELVTNGDFSNGTTGWTNQSATLTIVTGKLNVATTAFNQGASQTIEFDANKTYKICVDVTYLGTDYAVILGNAFGQAQVYQTGQLSSSRTVTFYVSPGAATKVLSLFSYSSGNVQYDNISVRELPGNHATQSTTTSRPTLSARYNLLTKTEQFDDAAWTKTLYGTGGSITITNNYAAAPDGTNTATRINLVRGDTAVEVYQRITNGSGTLKVWMKSLSGTPTIGTTYTHPSYGNVKTLTTDWAEYTIPVAAPTSGQQAGVNFILYTSLAGTSTAADFLVWHPDLRVANDGVGLPSYQRVNTATDFAVDGFPAAEVFDGTDDNEIAAAGGGSTTAFFWCSSIRVGKVGAVQTLFSDTGTNTGYRVRINASNQLELAAGNNTAYTTATTSDTLALGQRAVLTAWHDGTNLNVQINNGTVVQSAFATATAGTAQITIGKDNNAASSFFMGRLYEKVYLKDTVLSAANIAATKSFCAQKAKVTL